jgi:hypothetical protein
MKDVINAALRDGLARLDGSRGARKRHETKTVSLGRCLIQNVDDVGEALVAAEGEGFR